MGWPWQQWSSLAFSGLWLQQPRACVHRASCLPPHGSLGARPRVSRNCVVTEAELISVNSGTFA